MKIKNIIILALITIILIIPSYVQADYNGIRAKVIENKGIEEINQEDGTTKKVQKTQIKILEGEFAEEECEMKLILAEDSEDITEKTELSEKDNILVNIQEENGEITGVSYEKTVKQSYIGYIVIAILFIVTIGIGKTRVIKPIIAYVVTIGILVALLIFSIIKEWNLLVITSIISLLITLFVINISIGIKKKNIITISCTILAIAMSGIISYIFFDSMSISDTMLNIQIADILINIKELLCSMTILICCGICNIVSVIFCIKREKSKETYKTKSDNIIEGQRSLKL